MPTKNEIKKNWPHETGDYELGDPESPVAVITLGSHMAKELIGKGAGIAGSLHTENLGIEKVIVNTISNTNIRYMIVSGAEVQGHITGETMQALYDNGIDENNKRIINSPGAIPFVENLTIESVNRFRNQVTLINMVNNENIDEIGEKIQECIENDPGAYEEDNMYIDLKSKSDEETDTSIDSEEIMDAEPVISNGNQSLILIQTKIMNLNNQIKQIELQKKYGAGYKIGLIEGFITGILIMVIFCLLVLR